MNDETDTGDVIAMWGDGAQVPDIDYVMGER